MESGDERRPEGEVLDPLDSPLGVNLRSRDPPDLFRVRAEERVVETAAEVRRHPVLERVHPLPVTVELCLEVRQRTERGLEQSETGDDIAGLEWIGEVLTLVINPRQARPDEELVAHQ